MNYRKMPNVSTEYAVPGVNNPQGIEKQQHAPLNDLERDKPNIQEFLQTLYKGIEAEHELFSAVEQYCDAVLSPGLQDITSTVQDVPSDTRYSPITCTLLEMIRRQGILIERMQRFIAHLEL